MRIFERCACGSSIEVEGASQDVKHQIETWRGIHCGHRYSTEKLYPTPIRPWWPPSGPIWWSKNTEAVDNRH